MHRGYMLDFARVTEDAAIAAAHHMGHGDKNAADQAAVSAMRKRLNSLDVKGTIVIGEGERDEAPMLFIGEEVGSGEGTADVDFAVDPLECTNSVAYGRGYAMAVLAASPKGTLLHAPDTYMDKIAVGPACVGKVDLDWPVAKNIEAVAKALGKPVKDVTIVVLDRPRHDQLIKDIRAVGARISLISDGDVAGAIMPSMEEIGIDLLLGVGAAPEGVLAAAALKCLGGEIQCRFRFRNDDERKRAIAMGIKEPDKKMLIDDLVKGNDCLFLATGVMDGPMMQGVRFVGKTVHTETIIMRAKSGTVRIIKAVHQET
ncbi:fructose-bisphosphatase, class II [Candidatus Woesearchaeota archaeon CG1_02_57_44]|nr:MAG: fructose-bisphosphatase, class II [Candidatus Woesearchaeota archaeon CG1_02_57_44]PIN70258.1 MAG: fructose-bisphosphatase class II [Candidatus Woesearchaeota archaeon CG11_big_fil_rev_8_21_14_0_20_57_5]